MKKPVKMLTGLGLCLLLNAAAAGTALAAGWTSESGTWKYVDNNGSYAANEWKTSNGESYYLGSDGEMETDAWIDGTYYVNSQGAMVKNAWIQVTETGGTKEPGWYYLGSSGKLEQDGWKTIGDYKYCFDSDGRMRTGWYFEDDNTYYLGGGDDGAMKTGWRCLAFDEDEMPEEGDISPAYSSAGEDVKWFYFQTNGKAKKAGDGDYVTMTVDGRKYYFDENGVMLTGWQALDDAESGDATGISKFVYLGGDDEGFMAKSQWMHLSVHPGDSDDKDEITGADSDDAPQEGESYWYYFESDGTPAYLKTTASSMSAATTKVSGESYFFDQYGVMRTGLVKITHGSTEMVGYFNSGDGKMRTGKQSGIYDDDGEKHTFYFATSGSGKGAGYTGEKDGYLYYNGLLVEADDGTDYQAFEVDGDIYLVNESGKVQTGSKAYKSDGTYTYRISGGTLYYTDDDGDAEDAVTSGESLPGFSCNYEYEL